MQNQKSRWGFGDRLFRPSTADSQASSVPPATPTRAAAPDEGDGDGGGGGSSAHFTPKLGSVPKVGSVLSMTPLFAKNAGRGLLGVRGDSDAEEWEQSEGDDDEVDSDASSVVSSEDSTDELKDTTAHAKDSQAGKEARAKRQEAKEKKGAQTSSERQPKEEEEKKKKTKKKRLVPKWLHVAAVADYRTLITEVHRTANAAASYLSADPGAGADGIDATNEVWHFGSPLEPLPRCPA